MPLAPALLAMLLAQTPVEVSETFGAQTLADGLERLHDPDGTLSFEQASNRAFETVTGPLPNMGRLSGALWIRFTVKNTAPARQRVYIRVDWPRLGHVGFYAQTERGTATGRSGWLVPFSERAVWGPSHLFFLDLDAGASSAVYLQVNTIFEVLVPITIASERAAPALIAGDYLLIGGQAGMVLSLSIFAGLVFIRLRRATYLFFALSMTSYLSWWVVGGGWAAAIEPLARFAPLLLVLLMSGWFFLRLAFTRTLLGLATRAPRMDRILRALQWAGVPGLLVLQFLAPPSVSATAGSVASVFLLSMELYAGALALRAGSRLAGWYMLATGTLLAGLTIAAFIFSGVLQLSLASTRIPILIGVAGELFGLAYALAESIREVTEEREQALRRVEVERLGALHGLVSGVTHELNTPLGALRSSADSIARAGEKLLAADSASTPSAQRAIRALPSLTQTTRAATDRIDEVVHSLKRFAQLDEAEQQTCDLHEGLEGALTLLGPKMGERIQVKRSYEGPRSVPCRPAAINQVFMSVLENAVAAIEDRGQLRVKTEGRGDLFVVQVVDNGVGIAPERLSTLFSPKLTRQGERARMSMGLSTARSVIAQHQGRIDVQSQLGEGTTVTIEIPT